MLLVKLIDIYTLIIVASAVLSWFDMPPDHPVVQFLTRVTEPVLGAVRSWLPSMGGIDASPIVVLLGLHLIKNIVL